MDLRNKLGAGTWVSKTYLLFTFGTGPQLHLKSSKMQKNCVISFPLHETVEAKALNVTGTQKLVPPNKKTFLKVQYSTFCICTRNQNISVNRILSIWAQSKCNVKFTSHVLSGVLDSKMLSVYSYNVHVCSTIYWSLTAVFRTVLMGVVLTEYSYLVLERVEVSYNEKRVLKIC